MSAPRHQWRDRARLVASVVAEVFPAGGVVADLGCGDRTLGQELPRGMRYEGYDLPEWAPDDDVWPDGRWDVIVMAGVLERLAYPYRALEVASARASHLVVTYVHGRHELYDDLMNDLSPFDLEAMLAAAGWAVESVRTWKTRTNRPQQVYACRGR